MIVLVLGLWALGLVASAWVVVLVRMLDARREADRAFDWERRQMAWTRMQWGFVPQGRWTKWP